MGWCFSKNTKPYRKNAMPLVVNTNTASIGAQNSLSRTQAGLSSSFAKISSGLRISRAADDAAGLAVASSLNAQGRSNSQGMRNTNDAISIIQTAEGATAEVSGMLNRLRELAVQASSETLASTERSYVNDESVSLVSEIDRVANTTEFNGTFLTNASNTALNVQVGVNNTANDRIALTFGDLTSATGLGMTLDLTTTTGAQSAIAAIDTAIDSASGFRSDYGALQNRLEVTLNIQANFGENLAGAESAIRDADFAYETAQLTKNQILQQAGVSILAQANSSSQSALSLL
jgi:flagellin